MGQRIGEVERAIRAWHRLNEVSRRLEAIPGVGPITASVLAAVVIDPHLFRSVAISRRGSVWCRNSSGGKERLGRISKQAMMCTPATHRVCTSFET